VEVVLVGRAGTTDSAERRHQAKDLKAETATLQSPTQPVEVVVPEDQVRLAKPARRNLEMVDLVSRHFWPVQLDCWSQVEVVVVNTILVQLLEQPPSVAATVSLPQTRKRDLARLILVVVVVVPEETAEK
jgi:hypothetical protein